MDSEETSSHPQEITDDQGRFVEKNHKDHQLVHHLNEVLRILDFVDTFCFASVGTLHQSRAGVHVCCFVRLRAFRGIHPPNQRRKGGPPHPLPNLSFRRTPPTNTPINTSALTTGQWASHSLREDPSPEATEAPSQLLQHSHLGHRHKALLGSRPGTSPTQHHKTTLGRNFLARNQAHIPRRFVRTLLCATFTACPSTHNPQPLGNMAPTHGHLNRPHCIPKQDALRRVWTRRIREREMSSETIPSSPDDAEIETEHSSPSTRTTRRLFRHSGSKSEWRLIEGCVAVQLRLHLFVAPKRVVSTVSFLFHTPSES